MESEHNVEVLFFLPEDEAFRPRPHTRPYVWMPMPVKDLRVNYIYRVQRNQSALVKALPTYYDGEWTIPSEPYNFIPLL